MTRTELEGLITSPLRDTLDATQRALRSASLTASDLATVVLVGGSSRIPLVSHLLQSEFGVRTAMDTHPKHDIALGAVQYQPACLWGSAPAAAPTVAQWPTRGKKPAEPSPPPPPPAPTPPAPTPTGLGTRGTRPGANGPAAGPARGEEAARPSGVEAARDRGRGRSGRNSDDGTVRPTDQPTRASRHRRRRGAPGRRRLGLRLHP